MAQREGRKQSMSVDLESELTASFLDSGRMLANAGHVAALVAGVGAVAAPSTVDRLVFGSSLLFWMIGCWFTVRVMIDASLFHRLAGEPEDGWRRLDELLRDSRLRRMPQARTVADRRRGAIGRWRRQAIALGIQLATLLAAVGLRSAGF
jgi:hypothetical protein